MILLLLACTTTDSATPAGIVWTCGIYAPQAVLWAEPGEVGYRSVFDYDAEDIGVGTITYEGLGTTELDGVEVWVHHSVAETDDALGDHHLWTTTTWYLCDDVGLQQYAVRDDIVLTHADGSEVSFWATRAFSTLPLIYPLDLALGSVWTTHAVYTETHSDGTAIDMDTTVIRDARTEEEVTVPAGTFTALHIVMTDEAGTESPLYVAKEVGTVQSNEMVLRSHETFGP